MLCVYYGLFIGFVLSNYYERAWSYRAFYYLGYPKLSLVYHRLRIPFNYPISFIYDLQFCSLCSNGVTRCLTANCIECCEGLTTGYVTVTRGNVALVWFNHRIRI